MTSEYSEIFSILLSKVEAYEFVNMSEDDFNEIMTEYLHTGLAYPHLRKVFSELIADDITQTVEWELVTSLDDFSDKTFVDEILAESILCKWVEKHVKTQTLMKQFVGTSKEKYASPYQMLNQLRSIHKETEKSLRYKLTTYSFLNKNLRGG